MADTELTTLRVGKIETLTEEQFAIRELTKRVEKLEKKVAELEINTLKKPDIISVQTEVDNSFGVLVDEKKFGKPI